MDEHPMKMAQELTRQMNNLQRELDDLRRQERDTENGTQQVVSRLQRERVATNAMIATSNANTPPNINRPILMRRAMDLFNDETRVKNEAKERVRQIRERVSQLARNIESVKRQIVSYQAKTGLY